MQRVFQFKARGFWSSEVDINKLNDKITRFNNSGWQVVSMTTNTTLFGAVVSYSLLLEAEPPAKE
ncbi:hypothetical protein HHX48_13290 [Salinimonas sp. HHU 13199]|uniref:DUF4177 domain-containing protein n=1 Tax=Salinimonas profundi TaxID=2729140 RepID=A0ABR8LNU1_9ALTE|nr:hypothetical protein [Salinimonas profundi]MBD3586716.1 hypothetical protein [Salinimonas profundi]